MRSACRLQRGMWVPGDPQAGSGVLAPGNVIWVCEAHCVHVGGSAALAPLQHCAPSPPLNTGFTSGPF